MKARMQRVPRPAPVEAVYVPIGSELQRLRTSMAAGRPTLVVGPVGGGKTTAVLDVARELGRRVVSEVARELLRWEDLVGQYELANMTTTFVEGPLPTAMREGSVFVLDELHVASEQLLVGLSSVLDDRRSLTLRTGVIPAHKDFVFVGCYNPSSAQEVPELIRSRCRMIRFPGLDKAREIKLLRERESRVKAKDAATLVEAAWVLRQLDGLCAALDTRVLLDCAHQIATDGVACLEVIETALLDQIAHDEDREAARVALCVHGILPTGRHEPPRGRTAHHGVLSDDDFAD